MNDTLIITHNWGFYSCCSVKLFKIIEYMKTHRKIPNIIDCTKQFSQYKNKHHINVDITSHFFKFDDSIHIDNFDIQKSKDKREMQFSDYRLINFDQMKPLIDRYFQPNDEILQRSAFIKRKYKINCDNLLTVYYRSTDKQMETNIPSFQTIVEKVKRVKSENPDLQLLFMTDCINANRNIGTIFDDVIIIQELNQNHSRGYEHAKWLLSSVILLSKSHSIITTSGNVANWMILYRNNADNVYQYLNQKQFLYGIPNPLYDPMQVDFWLN